ncbi:MAG: EVE domain-containing protein [Proteobacteria bacterium]|nr:MAG: EVE domain-containing protein [Pseudomonadota bacterium]
MAHWLIKSEPDVFSIADLKAKKKTGWDGVRNYQARNYMRDGMKLGDLAFFYHSNAEPSGIAGVAKVCREAHPDPTQFEKDSDYFDPKATPQKPIWEMVEVEFVEAFPRVISLAELKADKTLAALPLVQKGTRLSVMPVGEKEWNAILKISKRG